jgi:hypothetical protein
MRWLIAGIAALTLVSSTPALSRQPTAEELHALFDPKQSEQECVNSFVLNSRTSHSPPPSKTVTVTEGRIYAQLLTPLHSSRSKIGDKVRAVVIDPDIKGERFILPPGSVLEGYVEGATKSNFTQIDGALAVRFYRAKVGNETIELSLAPQSEDKNLHPKVRVPTKKDKVRDLLMTATFLAVPLAVGSGGTSLAITAGAGAVIGGVLASDGKHLQGAVKGAWQGAGLSVLDPIVCKGASVDYPEGSTIMLRIADAVKVPETILNRASSADASGRLLTTSATVGIKPEDQRILSTKARILVPGAPAVEDSAAQPPAASNEGILDEYHRLVGQKNLAAALEALDRAETQAPGDEAIRQERANLMQLISGRGQAK